MMQESRELQWVSIDGGEAGAAAPVLLEEPFPPREPGDLVALTSSVRILGILSPLLLRRAGQSLEIVCGYRRYLAARLSGLVKVPALVADLEDAQAIRCYLSENLLRKPMDVHSEEDALEILRNLRDAWPGDADFASIEEKLTARKARLSAPALDQSPSRMDSPRSAQTEPDAKCSGNEDDRSDRVLALGHAYFDEVRATRSINVPRTEILVDSILEVAEEGSPLSIHGFSRLVDADLTAPHSILVTQLCARVAKTLSWSEERSRTFVLSGFLHDVGMVFVRNIVRAPRALKEEEGRSIRHHTTIGCALITGAKEWSPEVALSARDHHERWNGTGYPAGRKGTETSFPARAIGLIDAYAALTTPRPHRSALEPGFALERLSQAMKLGLFDPSLEPILDETLAKLQFLHVAPPSSSPLALLTRKSVELRGDLVTMLAKGST